MLQCPMDARRWSPLWVFVGGCLTGAALIGLHSRSGPESARNARRADDVALRSLKAGSAERRVHVVPAAVEVATRGRGEAPDAAERDKAEAGNSVAEVLARLETEYRQRTAPAAALTPAQASAPAVPGSDEPAERALANEGPRALAQEQEPNAVSAVSGASGPKLAASEHSAVVQAAAPAPEAPPPSGASWATLSADSEPTAPAAEEAARLASLRDEQARAFNSGQQQLAQMQQLAALQQATLLEQYTLFHLQLLSLSPASGTTVLPARSQHRAKAKGGRIVASLPSSISDTDNPWGFDLQQSVLVR